MFFMIFVIRSSKLFSKKAVSLSNGTYTGANITVSADHENLAIGFPPSILVSNGRERARISYKSTFFYDSRYFITCIRVTSPLFLVN